MPWEADLPNAGFTNSEPWLPMPDGWEDYSASTQHDDPNSMLNYYRSMIQRRKTENWMKSDSIGEVDSSSGILSFVKTFENKQVRVIMNFSDSEFRFDNDNTILRTSNSDTSNPFLRPGEVAYIEIH
jgi:alpha-glucosidase